MYVPTKSTLLSEVSCSLLPGDVQSCFHEVPRILFFGHAPPILRSVIFGLGGTILGLLLRPYNVGVNLIVSVAQAKNLDSNFRTTRPVSAPRLLSIIHPVLCFVSFLFVSPAQNQEVAVVVDGHVFPGDRAHAGEGEARGHGDREGEGVLRRAHYQLRLRGERGGESNRIE